MWQATIRIFRNIFNGLNGEYVLQRVFEERYGHICTKLDRLEQALYGRPNNNPGILEMVIRMDERLKRIESIGMNKNWNVRNVRKSEEVRLE